MLRSMTFAVVVAGALLVGAACAQAPAPLGTWTTATGNLDIEIAPCGQTLCGDVVSVHGNRSMSSANTPAAPPARVGLRILSDLRANGAEWRGRVFNRENGRTYDCIVRARGNGELEVRGYVLVPIFGQTQVWRRSQPAQQE